MDKLKSTKCEADIIFQSWLKAKHELRYEASVEVWMELLTRLAKKKR
jgi:hypothetical protein